MSHIDGTNGPDRADVRGTNGRDLIHAFGGNDTVTGLLGLDTMDGGSGWDTVDYTYSDDGMKIDLATERVVNLLDGGVEIIQNFEHVWGSQGNDRIYGDDGFNDLEGEGGDDAIRGRGGNDRLEGEAGNDKLYGDSGSDRLIGAAGADTLVGGSDADRFVYYDVDDSSSVGRDWVDGFAGAGAASAFDDRIELTGIDANETTAKDDAFGFLGERTDAEGRAAGAGALWTRDIGGVTYLFGNVDNDDAIELQIRINDGSTGAEDYWSPDFLL